MHKIPIGMDEFCDILETANKFDSPLSLISRLKDYYEEEFWILELPQLKDQLMEVYKSSGEEIDIIPKLMLLCDMAILYNTTICVIPD